MSLRYLIDTDWAIHYLNGHPEIVTRLIICLKGGQGCGRRDNHASKHRIKNEGQCL